MEGFSICEGFYSLGFYSLGALQYRFEGLGFYTFGCSFSGLGSAVVSFTGDVCWSTDEHMARSRSRLWPQMSVR